MNHAHLSIWPTVLTYAAIVLGLALAVLAYGLLMREQRLARPRLVTVQAVYGLIVLAGVLVLTGFVSEYMRLDFDSLQTEVDASSTALDAQRAKNAALEVKLQLVREVAHTLDTKKAASESAPAAAQDCAGSVQPAREQLVAVGQRLDAVVNR